MKPFLELKDVCKSFFLGEKEIPILENVSLTIHQGVLTSIQGVSGVGKTTLLNILGLLDESYTGFFSDGSTPFKKLSFSEKARWRNQKIGFVFQSFHLLKGLTVLENVTIPQRILRASVKEANAYAIELLDRFELIDKIHNFPFELSGGEQQRVALARALINKPALLLLDEPTGNLDEKSSFLIEELLREIHREFSLSMVTVTHNEAFAQRHEEKFYLSQKKLFPL